MTQTNADRLVQPKRRPTTINGVRWGLLALAAAAAITWYGAYGDPRHLASQERAVPFIIGVLVVLAALVFGLLVPAGLRGTGTGSARWTGASLALGIVALVALPVSFWSGLPLMLAVAAGVLAWDSRRARRSGVATAALVISVV